MSELSEIICRGPWKFKKQEKGRLTVLSVVEGPRHGFTRRVVASADSALVVPGLRVEDVVAACLLRSRTRWGDVELGGGGGCYELICCCRNSGPVYPAEALNADVEGIRPARRAVNHAVLQLVVRRRPGNPAEELAAIFHEYFRGRAEIWKTARKLSVKKKKKKERPELKSASFIFILWWFLQKIHQILCQIFVNLAFFFFFFSGASVKRRKIWS